MIRNAHILFIHIPKTAGTSFRLAAEEYYDKNNIFYDYTTHFKETSKCILEMIYEEQDHYKLYKHISKLDNSFLSGHFHVNKYAPLYDTLNVVSFVRDPVEQVLSHYNHYKNIHNYDKDLKSFIEEPRFRNVQSKVLGGKPIEYYGFLGLTEEYALSIDMFNTIYGTKLAYKHTNRKSKNSLNIDDIDEDTLDLIKHLNEKDIQLYERVKEQLLIRKKLYDNSLPFTHGFIQKNNQKEILGLAFQKESVEALEIDIYAGDKYLETVLAKKLRPMQVLNNVPRKGFIGFDYIGQSKSQDKVKLRAFVKETGQEIV